VFRIGETKITLRDGDLSVTIADALACPTGGDLSMRTGVASVLLRVGGEMIQQQASKKGPLKPGEAASTNAGDLPARWVIHAVTLDPDGRSAPGIISRAVVATVAEARRLGAATLAFPAYGTGIGNVYVEEAAAAMAAALSEALSDGDGPDEIVVIFTSSRVHDAFTKVFSRKFGRRTDDETVSALISEGMSALSAGRIIQAVKALQKVIAADPDNGEAYLYLGEAYSRSGDLKAAAQSYERALETNPDNAEAHLQRARLTVREGNLTVARRRMISVADRYPLTGAADEASMLGRILGDIRRRTVFLTVLGVVVVAAAVLSMARHVGVGASSAALMALIGAIVGGVTVLVGFSSADVSGLRFLLQLPPWGAITARCRSLPLVNHPAKESLPGALIAFGVFVTVIVTGASWVVGVQRTGPVALVPVPDTGTTVVDTTTIPPLPSVLPTVNVLSNETVRGEGRDLAIVGVLEVRSQEALPERGGVLVVGRIFNAAGVAEAFYEQLIPLDSLDVVSTGRWTGRFRLKTDRRNIPRYMVTAEWQLF
jgi:O-acetyl-ADP-ribose deacetylase (regulator of RNase III)